MALTVRVRLQSSINYCKPVTDDGIIMTDVFFIMLIDSKVLF